MSKFKLISKIYGANEDNTRAYYMSELMRIRKYVKLSRQSFAGYRMTREDDLDFTELLIYFNHAQTTTALLKYAEDLYQEYSRMHYTKPKRIGFFQNWLITWFT